MKKQDLSWYRDCPIPPRRWGDRAECMRLCREYGCQVLAYVGGVGFKVRVPGAVYGPRRLYLSWSRYGYEPLDTPRGNPVVALFGGMNARTWEEALEMVITYVADAHLHSLGVESVHAVNVLRAVADCPVAAQCLRAWVKDADPTHWLVLHDALRDALDDGSAPTLPAGSLDALHLALTRGNTGNP